MAYVTPRLSEPQEDCTYIKNIYFVCVCVCWQVFMCLSGYYDIKTQTWFVFIKIKYAIKKQ